MQQSRPEIKQNQILWRHSQVVRLASDGLSEREIATRLQISDTTVLRDIQILKQQAKQDVHKFITDYVPFEYEKTLVGLDGIIKNMSDIIAKSTEITMAQGYDYIIKRLMSAVF